MAEPPIDEERLVAWLDGELDESAAAQVAAAVAADPELAARAAAHRRLHARFTSAFDPIANEPVALPPLVPTPIVSLAAAREARDQRTRREQPARRWVPAGAIAASLVVGLVVGLQHSPAGQGVGDSATALALAPPVADALDHQLSGEPGVVRVSLTFRDHDGAWCRSFTARHIAGLACRDAGHWQLRYGVPVSGDPAATYRMAGGESRTAAVIATSIDGDPLDAAGERAARAKGWN
jgi:anti-sigma factor RsiW